LTTTTNSFKQKVVVIYCFILTYSTFCQLKHYTHYSLTYMPVAILIW